jgi:hypothetical protein
MAMELLIDGDPGVRTNSFRRSTYTSNMGVESKARVDHPTSVTLCAMDYNQQYRQWSRAYMRPYSWEGQDERA